MERQLKYQKSISSSKTQDKPNKQPETIF